MISKIIIALYVLTTAAALVTMKLGSSAGAPIEVVSSKINFNLTPLFILGGFLYVASFLLYTYLISKFNLGYIIPLTTAIVYILIFVASAVVFKEAFTLMKITGIALILIGVTLLNMNK